MIESPNLFGVIEVEVGSITEVWID